MRRRLFDLPLALALALMAGAFSPACAQTSVAAISASSGNVAAATAAATLPAATGKTTYICGFVITSTASTAAAITVPTVNNTAGGTMSFVYASVAGATVQNQPLQVTFSPCIQANATNTTITVSVPSLGAGNTNSAVVAWGYQY